MPEIHSDQPEVLQATVPEDQLREQSDRIGTSHRFSDKIAAKTSDQKREIIAGLERKKGVLTTMYVDSRGFKEVPVTRVFGTGPAQGFIDAFDMVEEDCVGFKDSAGNWLRFKDSKSGKQVPLIINRALYNTRLASDYQNDPSSTVLVIPTKVSSKGDSTDGEKFNIGGILYLKVDNQVED
jgi:hypothetical protein